MLNLFQHLQQTLKQVQGDEKEECSSIIDRTMQCELASTSVALCAFSEFSV